MSDRHNGSGGQSRSAKCYNCGSHDHFLTTCPEPTRESPAGLVAALAESSQNFHSSNDYADGQDNRPMKRQKTNYKGPIVTRFPAPSIGPVVTRFAPPPNIVPAYGAHSYYGGQPAPAYQQTPAYQNQQYGTPVASVPQVGYQPYSQQQAYNQSLAVLPQYAQPQPITHPGYDPSHPYGQNTHQAAQYHYGSYPSGPSPQQYGYESSQQYYGQQTGMGQPAQSYPPYQGLSQPPTAQNQAPRPAQHWTQPPQASQDFAGIHYDSGHPQYYQSYSGHHHSTARQVPFQASYGDPNLARPDFRSEFVPPVSSHAFGYQNGGDPQHHPVTSGPPVSADHQPGFQTKPHGRSKSELANEEQQFNWDFQKIFQEKKPDRPADPIGCPLPAVFDAAPIPPPAYSVTSVASKYVRPSNLEVFSRGVRQTLQWALLKFDPAFNDINLKSPLIPLNEVGKWAAERQNQEATQLAPQSAGNTPLNFEQDDADYKLTTASSYEEKHANDHVLTAQSGRRFSNSDDAPRYNRSRTPSARLSSTPTLENFGTPILDVGSDDAWAPHPDESIEQMETSVGGLDPGLDPSDRTEAFLASLGVSGAPKPVPQKRASFSSLAGNHRSIERELSQDSSVRRPSRQDSGYASARGSYSNPTGNVFEHGSPHGTRQAYSQNQPPPPPPPRYGRRQFDGSTDSPPSDGSGRDRPARRSNTHDIQNGGVHNISPLSPTSAELLSHEKQAAPERVNGKKPEPQRQVDDVTPKMKRRQPKVADAYSRRW